MPQQDLLQRAQSAFPGQVVLKSLTQETLFQRVPRFVVEYLLARAGGTEDAAHRVKKLLEERYLGPGHQEWIKDQLFRYRRIVLIDRLEVQVDLQAGGYRGRIGSLPDSPLEVDPDLPNRSPGVLYGQWGTLELRYDLGTKRVYIQQFIPFQAHLRNLSHYQQGRKAFTEEEWVVFLLGSVGISAAHLSSRLRLLYLARLAPLVEPNLHVMELGPRQTGKTYLLRNTSPEAFVISGGKVSTAVLFYNLRTRRPGLIPTYQVLIFDEIAHTAWDDQTVVAILKDYMESGQFSRGERMLSSDASLVFLGNVDGTRVPLTRVLPDVLRGDTAFLDRIHGILPGHEFPKITGDLLYQGPGLVVDYLSAAFKLLRQERLNLDLPLPKGLTQRDVRAIRKWVSAFLKLLYPGGDWPPHKPEELMGLALEFRERVCHELHHYNPEEFPLCTWTQGQKPKDDGLTWDTLFPLWNPEYHPLFKALMDAGVPPPDEGPEDLVGPEGVLGQSLARWGDRYLLPMGVEAPVKGLSVKPNMDPEEIREFIAERSS